MGRHSLAEAPAEPQPENGVTGTGSHRAVGKSRGRRRIAAWPIAGFVLVVLTTLGWLGWSWADNKLNAHAEAEAGRCPAGETTVNVLVTPNLENPVRLAADAWNRTGPVVRDHCPTIQVQAISAPQALEALIGTNTTVVQGAPAAWIADSPAQVNELGRAKPELIASSGQPITPAAHTYVGLAGDSIDIVRKQSAQIFRDFLTQPAQQANFPPA